MRHAVRRAAASAAAAVASASSSASSTAAAKRHISSSARSLSSPLGASSASFLTTSNAVYVDSMHEAWLKDRSSVHASWDAYFTAISRGASPADAFVSPPSAASASASAAAVARATDVSHQSPLVSADMMPADKRARLVHMVRAFQVRGHEQASLDPLGLHAPRKLPELQPETYGFTAADMDKPLEMDALSGQTGLLGSIKPTTTLREALGLLQQSYCGTFGVEYMHLRSTEECDWVRSRIEVPAAQRALSRDRKKKVLERLNYADTFEWFLSQKFSTAKRFGVEGAESLIPGLKSLIDRATELGVESIVVGMPHRGRLNVLGNVIRKPLEVIFREFKGLSAVKEDGNVGDWSMSGDVKYHMGTSHDRVYPDGRKVHLSLMANPSHLEAVNPLVAGKTRAKMHFEGDPEGRRHMGLLLHGDAAFAGQGIVAETMQFSGLRNYGTGGTVHVVVNNQVGFTTDPQDSRSTLHSTDLGKAFDVPIFHVNADDPEAVDYVFRVAAEWRQQFRRDVIVDLVGYRRHGHNEIDQPKFTQPLMYSAIAKHKTALKQYQERLVAEGSASADEVKQLDDAVKKVFADAFAASATYQLASHDWLDSKWKGFKGPGQLSRIKPTGVDRALLHKIGESISALPAGFDAHPTIRKVIEGRREMIHTGSHLDWATGEALAFGSLLAEDNHVRLSGQDVERGTFSHRHAVLTDQSTGRKLTLLNKLGLKHQAQLVVANSPLSEFGVMGFELGYSLENPNQLVLWEAQFGDFSNGAQVIIDQFLSSGEDKWLRQSGLTILLPHGYDGQGAEHSSCRIERYLQSSDEDADQVITDEARQLQRANWQICNVTTPANYFHVLRRQVHREFRKPLVIATPKALLRHKLAVSTLDDMAAGTSFLPLIPEAQPSHIADAASVRRVVFCTGKLYYELLAEREHRKINNVALVRVEQISPFPFAQVAAEVAKYSNAEVVWAQEEPKNMGAWMHVQPRIESATRAINGVEVRPKYAGRPPRASPAVGSAYVHKTEQDSLIHTALDINSFYKKH